MNTTITDQMAAIELTDAELDAVVGAWCGGGFFCHRTIIINNVFVGPGAALGTWGLGWGLGPWWF